jgi:hypothetical protein
MDKKPTNVDVMEIFMTKIFEDKMKETYPHILELDAEKKAVQFKIWGNGVAAGLELNDAIENLKEIV